jgi:FkbM family methyltransferase
MASKSPLKRLWHSFWDTLGYELYPTKVYPESIDGQGRLRLAPVRTSMDQALRQLRRLGYVPDTIIDVGAADGTPELPEVFPEAYFIWLEPLREFVPALEAMAARHKGEVHNAAAGPKEGSIVLHAHPFQYGSSVLPEVDGAVADGEPRDVPLVTLDGLVKGRDVGSVLLKVDVQGYELDVLNGAKELLPRCEAVILEVSFFRFHSNEPDVFEVISYMKERGFVMYDLFEGHNRPIDNALAQRDILFVQENGRFRTTHNWATPEQRKRLANHY